MSEKAENVDNGFTYSLLGVVAAIAVGWAMVAVVISFLSSLFGEGIPLLPIIFNPLAIIFLIFVAVYLYLYRALRRGLDSITNDKSDSSLA